ALAASVASWDLFHHTRTLHFVPSVKHQVPLALPSGQAKQDLATFCASARFTQKPTSIAERAHSAPTSAIIFICLNPHFCPARDSQYAGFLLLDRRPIDNLWLTPQRQHSIDVGCIVGGHVSCGSLGIVLDRDALGLRESLFCKATSPAILIC